MAISKFGFKDWKLGWWVPQGTGGAYTRAVTLTNSAGVEYTPANPLPIGTTSSGMTPASITRSANTTTYTANTAWGGGTSIFTFPNLAGAGKTFFLPQIDIHSSANPTLKLQGILWLFSVSPQTVLADNATFNIAAADYANLTGGTEGGIPFTLTANQATGAANSGVSLTMQQLWALASGSNAIYGMVQVVNAYVPASGEILTVTLSWIGVS